MKCSNILPVGILLLIIICSEFSLIKAENSPLTDIHPHITPGELLIRLTPGAAADVEQLHANAPISILHAKHNIESLHPLFPYLARPSLNPNLKRIYLLRFAPDAPLEALKAAYQQNPLIEAVEYNYLRPTLADPVVPNDPKYPEQWSLPLMKLPQAWAVEKGDQSVVIAIIDSGIDYRHDDLAPKAWINPREIPENGLDDDGNGYIDDVYGWDFTDAPNLQAEGDYLEGDNEPIDESGHGTHVAGIAGAMPNNGIGIAGVAWECPLMAIRAGLSLGGSSRMQDDDSASAIVYAADNGASVINMSWGSERRSFVIQDAIDYAYAHGAVLVAAAGNSQKPAAIFPAAYRKVIAVASTEQNQQRFYQSNFGASIDIGAPGNVILSTQINNQYRLLTGTSMASPHVAGVAALLFAKRPALTHEEVRHILINTADPVHQEDSDELDERFVGAGTVNAERALFASGALQARILIPETNSGGADSITFVGNTGGYKFQSWQLSYGESTVPTEFTPFTQPAATQKIGETLAVWDTTTVPEGIYTARLTVTATDGHQTHDQVVLSVDRTPPQVISLTATETLYGERSLTIFTWATDDVTQNTLYYRRKGSLAPFAPIATTDLGVEHSLSLGFEAGAYQFFVESENTTRLKTREDNGGAFYAIDVVGGHISPSGFTEKSLDIPPLHIASVTADFDRDGQPEIVGSPLSSDTLDTELQAAILAIYERLPSGRYQLAHTLESVENLSNLEGLTTWAVDDTDADGLLEILATDDERTFLIESSTPRGYPHQIIWETPFLSGGTITDVDRDGQKEIIGADNNNDRLLVFEYDSLTNTHIEKAVLVNETPGSNVFAQRFAIDDFDGDGRTELVAGDGEGELFIYESVSTNNTFRLEWQTQLPLKNITQFTSGDLTGDGSPEFVVGGLLSLPDNPSGPLLWKFFVFTHTPRGYALLTEGEREATLAIAPHRRNANSLAIADLDRDGANNLIIATYPNLYVTQWDGVALRALWHRRIEKTPMLFTAELNQNGFDEFYGNLEDGIYRFESVFATDPDGIDRLTPWNIEAKPLTEKAVQVTWNAQQDDETTEEQPRLTRSFTVYRAQGEKEEAPTDDMFEKIRENLTVTRFLDRHVAKDNTYWYAITVKDTNATETPRTEPVAATPREPPQLIRATYHQPGKVVGTLRVPSTVDSMLSKEKNVWVIVTFDRRMNLGIADESRYVLRKVKRIDGVNPVSAIRDRMGTRALLAFDAARLLEHFGQPLTATADQYEISVSNVADIDENAIRGATRPLEMPSSIAETAVSDLMQVRVYPNPVRPNVADKGVITFDRIPIGTRIQLFTAKGELLETLDVTEQDHNRKKWWLTSNNTADVSTGIYIYVLEFDSQKKIGKIAVIK
ncbi:S8 family serine peptidase [Candidatus Poribacteria bacterium]|nr:S8 family serine peptidase [Candidatus Poribacteria bacterium]MYB00927.1 S8 family serine peptidase [Candidatus Poribacteria bacterium]